MVKGKQMMLAIFLVMSLLLVSVGCSSTSTFTSNGNSSIADFENYESFKAIKASLDEAYFVIDDEVLVNADLIKKLTTLSSFEEVSIIQEEREDVSLHYYGIFAKKDNDKLPIITSELGEHSRYEVEWERLVGNNRARFDIRVPNSLALDFDIATSSGHLKGDLALANTIALASSSGSIQLVSDKVQMIKVDSSSGAQSIKLNDYASITVASKSGSITIETIAVHDLEGESSSGAITILAEVMDGAIDVESSSGSVSMRVEASDRHVDLESASGKISYYGKVAEKIDGKYRFLVKENEDSIVMKIKTTSGAIDITK